MGGASITPSVSSFTRPQLINVSGQLRVNGSNSNWYVRREDNSDLNRWDRNRGAGTTPSWQWRDSISIIPAGVAVSKIVLNGHTDTNNSLDSFEVAYAVKKRSLGQESLYGSTNEIEILNEQVFKYEYSLGSNVSEARSRFFVEFGVLGEPLEQHSELLLALRIARRAGTNRIIAPFSITLEMS